MRGYNLISELTIHNNDEVYHYNLDVGYKKDNYYRIEFVNTSNDHRQILLKNDDGVYVVTLRSLQQKII